VAHNTKPGAFVRHLQCRACGGGFLGDSLLRWPACPSCGAHALVLVTRLDRSHSWWPLPPRVEVA